MNNDDALKQFKELGEEAVLLLAFEDTEEYRVIRGQVMIERLLDSLLDKNLTKYKKLLKRNRIYFDLKVDLCLSLNLISERLGNALHTLNKIRNKLSHEKTPKISQDEIKRLNTGFYKEPMFQKALEFVYEKGYKDALMLSTLFLYWEVSRVLTESKKAGVV
ncbi:hypothetical protein ACFLU1_07410 [Chloroflexota bacterium]